MLIVFVDFVYVIYIMYPSCLKFYSYSHIFHLGAYKSNTWIPIHFFCSKPSASNIA